jgi:beta-lactam-binding protein with PASTA domain
VSRAGAEAPAEGTGADSTTIIIHGDVSGQVAVGSDIYQMRVERILGNVVNVVSAVPAVTARPDPVRILPRAPYPVYDRIDELAQILAALDGGVPVQLSGLSGIGKSTLLRHLANRIDAGGAVVHLSARGHSRDDLLQLLFETFYASAIPIKPGPGELRNRLQAVRATVLLDDADLSDDDLDELLDIAPGCSFVLVSGRAHRPSGARAVALSGLPADAAGELFGYALGRPPLADEAQAIADLCARAGGLPGQLLQLGAGAAGFIGPLARFVATLPPFEPEDEDDRVVIGLLAAVAGLQLDAEQLVELSGLVDVAPRLARWLARGLVQAVEFTEAGGRRTVYTLSSGVELDPVAWRLDERRAEINRHFDAWARRNQDAVLRPGPRTESLRILHDDARRRGSWGSVLVLGTLLGTAFALAGRWDAWRSVARTSVDAAAQVGDPAAEALAMHQLGTQALCAGDRPTAETMLRGALQRREDLGDTAGAAVTAHNLSLIVPFVPVLPPEQDQDDGGSGAAGGRSGAGAAGRATGRGRGGLAGAALTAGKVLAVAAPLAAALLYTGSLIGNSPSSLPQVTPDTVAFTTQRVNQASDARAVRLVNSGRSTLHVAMPEVVGGSRGEFVIEGSTCRGELAAGQSCTTEVIFTPAGTGAREAILSWDIEETDNDPTAALTGSGEPADPARPTAEPAGLAFAEQPRGTTSAAQQVRIVAPAAGPVTLGPAGIEGAEAADFVLDRDTCSGAELAAGADCRMDVRFGPTAPGGHSARLTVDGASAVDVPLSGTAGEPPEQAVQAVPGALTFADQPVGTVSAGQRITLTNRAPGPVELRRVDVAGSSEFTVEQTSCKTGLAPGEQCAVSVVFAPQRTGARAARLVVDGPGSGPSVPLQGTAIDAAPDAPVLSPSLLSFADRQVGTASPPQTVTVTNRASVPVRLTAASVAPASLGFRPDTGPCTAGPIAAGGSCAIPVVFAPDIAGRHTGQLALSFEGSANRSTVAMTGVANDPAKPTVPDLTGLDRNAAEKELGALKLVLGRVSQQPHPTAAPATVIDQSPRRDVVRSPGDPVDITLSAGPEKTEVPRVIGETESAAVRLIDAAHLRIGGIVQQPDPSLARGSVIGVTPAAGEQVDVGSAVSLVVSSGSDVVAVPPVVGKSAGEAAALLDGRGLRAGAITRKAPEEPAADLVSGSDPAPGEQVEPGREVALTVSTGPAPVTVPKVLGFERAAAEAMVRLAGLQVGAVSEQNDAQVPAGRVVSTGPGVDAPVDRDSAVDLVVSRGPVTFPMPRLEGRTLDAARRILAKNELVEHDVVRTYDSTVTRDVVLGSDPAEGASVSAGAQVTLTVSDGPEMVAVPEPLERPLLDAFTQELQKRRLPVGKLTFTVEYGGPGPITARVTGASALVGGTQTKPPAQAPVGTPVDLEVELTVPQPLQIAEPNGENHVG